MDATLDVVKRTGRGKNEARRLRVGGQIPAVVYGVHEKGKAPEGVSVAADPKDVLRILHSEAGANTLITLKLDGGESRVMVKDFQLDPVTRQLLHADFYQLAMDRAITVTVPVILSGDAPGVKLDGGMLDFLTREVHVECLPANIPERLDVDVSELRLNQSIRLRDLPENPSWKILDEPETMLVHIVLPKAEAAAASDAAEVDAAAPGSEPDAAKKGKAEKNSADSAKKDSASKK
jgi:large subunit ribosomal protein L25